MKQLLFLFSFLMFIGVSANAQSLAFDDNQVGSYSDGTNTINVTNDSYQLNGSAIPQLSRVDDNTYSGMWKKSRAFFRFRMAKTGGVDAILVVDPRTNKTLATLRKTTSGGDGTQQRPGGIK
jgi:hypothetical protein